MNNRPFHARLRFALAGIATVWRRERSFRTQAAAAVASMVVLALLRPGSVWTAIIVLVIALVLALEMVNSALEYLIDHVHPSIAAEIGHAKDAAAGAVLIASGTALVIAATLWWSVAA